MSDFAWMCLMFIGISFASALPFVIRELRRPPRRRSISLSDMVGRIGRGERYTVGCACPHHPHNCYGHPNKCGCSVPGEGEAR